MAVAEMRSPGRPAIGNPPSKLVATVARMRREGRTDGEIAAGMGLTRQQFALRFGLRYGDGGIPRPDSVIGWISKAMESAVTVTPTGLAVVMQKTKGAAHKAIKKAVARGLLVPDLREESGYARSYSLTKLGRAEVDKYRNTA